MKVKIKKLHKEAVIPAYAKTGDAGMDLTAVSVNSDEYGNLVYGTGLAFEIPEGYVGLVFPRSSNHKKDVILTNCVGVIDSGYRGEVMFKYKPIPSRFKPQHTVDVFRIKEFAYEIGDRIGQIVIIPYPQIEFEEVEELSETERGIKGYGSTGE